MGNWDDLCPGCFNIKGNTEICPHCNYDEGEQRSPLALSHRTLINKQFLVGRVLGKPGGFGVTYLGWDINLETWIAIKEYLPRDLAGRDTNRLTIIPHSKEDGELFQFGLEQFIQEARILAKFDHPNVVRVRSFFEENDTAYLVMDYYDGISLAEYLNQEGGKIPEQVAVNIMMPILDGLREVHAKGFLHRDIKPHNIYLTADKRPILLDFGTARLAMGERSRSLSVVLTPGFAPYEQYHRKGEQGPWTDIYACGAVLYQMLTGTLPPEATERIAQDEIIPPDKLIASISSDINQVIMKALATESAQRPQSVQQFQDMLVGAKIRSDAGKAGYSYSYLPPVPAGESLARKFRLAMIHPGKNKKPVFWKVKVPILMVLILLCLWGIKDARADGTLFNLMVLDRNKANQALIDAANSGQEQEVKKLLHAGVSPDVTNNDKWTPLALAINNNHTAVVKALASTGANPSIKTNDGKTPLSILVDRKDINLEMLTSIINGWAKSSYYDDALWLASKYSGNSQAIKLLLDAGANPNIMRSGTFNITPLHNASSSNDIESVRLLIKAGADPNSMNTSGITPLCCLFLALSKDRPDIVQVLLSAGANPNTIDDSNVTPLWWAVQGEYRQSIPVLLKGGANPNLGSPSAMEMATNPYIWDFNKNKLVTDFRRADIAELLRQYAR